MSRVVRFEPKGAEVVDWAREIAAREPFIHFGDLDAGLSCFWCESIFGDIHDKDCVWLRAKSRMVTPAEVEAPEPVDLAATAYPRMVREFGAAGGLLHYLLITVGQSHVPPPVFTGESLSELTGLDSKGVAEGLQALYEAGLIEIDTEAGTVSRKVAG